MSKFKVGDRVIASDRGFSHEPGWPKGVVTAVHQSRYEVAFRSGVGWTHFERELTPDTTTSQPLTGGLTSYYLARIDHPQRDEQPPYTAECEDIIGALDMTFDEGNLLKALWRSANARKGNGKPDNKALYDAQKMVHSAGRILKRAERS